MNGLKKNKFTILTVFVFFLLLTSCNSVKIEIQDSDKNDKEKIPVTETCSDLLSSTDESNNEHELAPEERRKLSYTALRLTANELQTEEKRVVYKNTFIPCGDYYLNNCFVNSYCYASLTDGNEFLSLIKMDIESYYVLEYYENYSVSIDGLVVTVKCEEAGRTLVLDFENKSYEDYFSLSDKSLLEMIDTSLDGKLSLWTINEMSSGDVFSYYLALKNNETGEIDLLEEVGTVGGMYGGYWDAGFFENNDIYVSALTKLMVLDAKTNHISFNIKNNFYLGRTEETNKELYSFYRNPLDHSYIVVYSEYMDTEKLFETDYLGIYEYPYTYQIGFMDPEGNLLESYDTGAGVLTGEMKACNVFMKITDDNIILCTKEDSLSESFMIGVFNRETHEFNKHLER